MAVARESLQDLVTVTHIALISIRILPLLVGVLYRFLSLSARAHVGEPSALVSSDIRPSLSCAIYNPDMTSLHICVATEVCSCCIPADLDLHKDL